jgi:hypothetical protein
MIAYIATVRAYVKNSAILNTIVCMIRYAVANGRLLALVSIAIVNRISSAQMDSIVDKRFAAALVR